MIGMIHKRRRQPKLSVLNYAGNAVIYQYRGRGALATAKPRDDVRQDMKQNPIGAKRFPLGGSIEYHWVGPSRVSSIPGR
jgi:hypothetical protein